MIRRLLRATSTEPLASSAAACQHQRRCPTGILMTAFGRADNFSCSQHLLRQQMRLCSSSSSMSSAGTNGSSSSPSAAVPSPSSSPSSFSLSDKRIYHFFINERGHLYHLYDIKAVLPCLLKVREDPLARQGLPSGPAHMKDMAFINFFVKNLFINAIGGGRGAAVNTAASGAIGAADAPSTSCNSGSSSANGGNGTTATGYVAPEDLPALTDPSVFPFVSYCGNKEVNFIACEKLPIVFHMLVMEGDVLPSGVVDPTTSNKASSNTAEAAAVAGGDGESLASANASQPLLVFAGTLAEPFDPSALRVDDEGYLYHVVSSLTPSAGPPTRANRRPSSSSPQSHKVRPTMGLVGADVGLRLGFEFIDDDEAEAASDGSASPASGYAITWKGRRMNIPPLEDGRI